MKKLNYCRKHNVQFKTHCLTCSMQAELDKKSKGPPISTTKLHMRLNITGELRKLADAIGELSLDLIAFDHQQSGRP